MAPRGLQTKWAPVATVGRECSILNAAQMVAGKAPERSASKTALFRARVGLRAIGDDGRAIPRALYWCGHVQRNARRTQRPRDSERNARLRWHSRPSPVTLRLHRGR